jgi:alpha-mannosidase
MTGVTHVEAVFRRLDRILSQYLIPRQYTKKSPVSISAWKVGGEPVSFETAKAGVYEKFEVGQSWGAAWDTWWFQVSGTVPQEWGGDLDNYRPELIIDLGKEDSGPGFQAEALVRRDDGEIIKAVEPCNYWVPLPDCGDDFHFYVEAAANPKLFVGPPDFITHLGDKGVSTGPEIYTMNQLEAALLDVRVWNLIQEFEVLEGLAKEIDPDRTRYANIMASLEAAMNVLDPEDISGTAQAARDCLVDVLSQPAPADAHSVLAVGHAHIDTAWLWPFRETKRKVARTFSNVVELMDEDPELKFAASSAQQYKWLKDNYPQAFAQVQEKVAKGDFIPVGNMWVECDANMPSGESLARQFLYATRFYEENLGTSSKVVWLPDSFGYSAGFPQIAKLAGCDYFLTQKISWNDTNTFPHNSFMWQGIDGTEIFTHFPPSDTYGSRVSPEEIARSEKRYSEKGKGNTSLLLFGYGDGGGGPTREMMHKVELQKSLEGSPSVRIASPQEFFEQAAGELKDPPRWVGELYLELHRGTLTSEAKIKQGNRRMESLLREVELWSAQASIEAGFAYPYDELQDMWEKTLLYQFHDVLPGSAIAWVYEEVEASYAQMEKQAEQLIEAALTAIAGQGSTELSANAAPFAQLDVAPMAVSEAHAAQAHAVRNDDGTVSLSNERVSYTLSSKGLITSAIDKVAGEEHIDPAHPGNDLQLFRDVPSQWEAWDIEKTYMDMPLPAPSVESMTLDDFGEITVSGVLGSSAYEQKICLDTDVDALQIHTHVDWHESDKLLKQAFPVKDYSAEALSEIQYGHIGRPVHTNTSWDEARFETLAHRWVFAGDRNRGVGLANDSKYGHDIREIIMSDGRPGTSMRVSMLRATHWPVPSADVAVQDFTVSFAVGRSVLETVQQGYRLNVAARTVTGAHAVSPLVSVASDGVLVESVKMAEDRSGDLIVRLYEALGSVEKARVTLNRAWSDVREVGLIEVENPNVPASMLAEDQAHLDLKLHPFQVVTLRFAL